MNLFKGRKNRKNDNKKEWTIEVTIYNSLFDSSKTAKDGLCTSYVFKALFTDDDIHERIERAKNEMKEMEVEVYEYDRKIELYTSSVRTKHWF